MAKKKKKKPIKVDWITILITGLIDLTVGTLLILIEHWID